MYGVKIITENGEVALDMTEPSFPYTFESSSVAELQDQSASWSYTIQIPRTSHNERVLEEVGEPFTRTDIPYRRVGCNVYADGIRIIHNGVMFIDRVTDNEYEVQILSGNADVFELLKEVDYVESGIATRLPLLSLPAVNINAPYIYVPEQRLSPDGVITNNSTNGNVKYYAMPLVLIGSQNKPQGLLARTLAKIGYTLETNTEAEELDKMYISLESRNVYNQEERLWSQHINIVENGAGYQQRQLDVAYQNDKYIYKADVRAVLDQQMYVDSQGNEIPIEDIMYEYTHVGGYIDIYMLIGPSHIGTKVRIDASNYMQYIDTIQDAIEATIEYDYIQYKGEKICVNFYAPNYDWEYDRKWYNGLTLDLLASSAVLYGLNDTDLAISGNNINLDGNIVCKNGMELIKLLAQVFGWIINIKGNTIQAYNWEYIKSQKSRAIDWTEKICNDEDREQTYTIGEYAQHNTITFAENSTIPFTDSDIFRIENKNIAQYAEVLSIPTISGRENTTEVWARKDEESTEYEFDCNGSHLMQYQQGILSHYPISKVRENYQPLIDTLQRVEVLNVKILLTAVDIMQFNPYLPIYLKQTGAYYYVNKISEWEEGKPCEVELLRI